MDQECVKLTGYFTKDQAGGKSITRALDELFGAGVPAACILLGGTDGSRRRRRVHVRHSLHLQPDLTAGDTDGVSSLPQARLDQPLRFGSPGFVTVGRARLLSEYIDPVGLWDNPGEATRLTVYFSRQDRIYQVPAYEVICELLHRRGIPGATVLAGIDGTFASRHACGPMMVTAVGAGQRLGLILPELGGLLRRPLVTLEQVRVCKRDGQLISPPQVVPNADADGRPLWLKVTVYACDSTRHDGRSLHRALSHQLHAVGIGSVITLRGMWGFRGDRAPHGGRHIPAVTVVMDAPERMFAAFSVIDELTAKRGLVTSESVAAVSANGDDGR